VLQVPRNEGLEDRTGGAYPDRVRMPWVRASTIADGGTIFDRTTVPLRLGFLAMVLLAVDHGGTSAWALSRELGLRYATA